MIKKILLLVFLPLSFSHLLLAQNNNNKDSVKSDFSDTALVIPTIAIEDDNVSVEDDGVSAQNSGSMVIATNDVFVFTSSYIFLDGYFQPRGSGRNGRDVETNGVSVNDGETGNAAWSTFGGLNDVFRGRNVTWGLNPSEYSFGGIMGTTYVSATAADQRAETKVSFSNTDRLYRNRVMFTKSTGMMKNGWAFSFSANKRWAETEAFVPGTFYNGYSYYGAISKRLKNATLNLTTYGSPTQHAKGGSATQETFDLDNNKYYNPYWGYVNGVNGAIRSSKVENVFQPVTILNYDYRPNENTRWNTAIAYEAGKDKNSFIDYYNAPNPYGNYYQKLPSYYLTMVPPDSATANIIRNNIINNRNVLQINWKNLYQANYINYQTVYNVNGNANQSYSGNQSAYVLSNDVVDLKKYSFNTNYEHAIDQHITIMGGLSLVDQHSEKYEQLADLLGGDYFINYNQFASQQYVGNPNYYQNNLKDPNAIVKVGDKYGYDYAINVFNAQGWGQAVFNYNKLSYFIAAQAGQDGFNRDGFYQNGLFANNSYGASATHSFFDYAFKGGASYSINRHNYIFFNAGYITAPPTVDNTYISAETRDYIVNNPTTQKTSSLEMGYEYKDSKIHAKILGYVTDTKDATEIKRFFNDDPAYYTFVNYVMQGEDIRSIGTESYIEYRINRSFRITAVAAIGQTFYTNDPNISVYLDNDTTQQASSDKAYIKNYYVSNGPQSAYRLGFNYRPKQVRDLSIDLNCNYYDRNYVEINPNRRTEAAGDLVPVGSVQWHEIYDQQKLPSAFIVDLRVYKVFHLSDLLGSDSKMSKSNLTVGANVGNLLNNDVINFGYEQLRFDFENKNPDKYPNKYVYGLGRNYSINIALTF